MANDLQVSSQELSALLSLAWRAPKLPAEELWLQELCTKVSIVAAQAQQDISKEKENGTVLGRV